MEITGTYWTPKSIDIPDTLLRGERSPSILDCACCLWLSLPIHCVAGEFSQCIRARDGRAHPLVSILPLSPSSGNWYRLHSSSRVHAIWLIRDSKVVILASSNNSRFWLVLSQNCPLIFEGKTELKSYVCLYNNYGNVFHYIRVPKAKFEDYICCPLWNVLRVTWLEMRVWPQSL